MDMTFKQKLLAIQIYIHISFIIGLVLLPIYYTIPSIIITHIIWVGLCGTVFFHRVVSHRNKVNPVVEKILLALSTVGCVSSAMAWAGVHRKHHRYSDTIYDPHSPLMYGKFKTYWQLSGRDNDILRYVPDLLKDKWYVFQHVHYFKIIMILHTIGLLFIPAPLYWSLLICPAFLMWFIGSLVNCFGHDKDGPLNSATLGVITAGEGNHLNHHHDPQNAYFGHPSDWGYALYKLVGVK